MAEAPKAPVKLKLEGKSAPKALRTFVHSSTLEEANKTYLRGERVVGFPTDLVADYRKRGFIAPVAKKEEE